MGTIFGLLKSTILLVTIHTLAVIIREWKERTSFWRRCWGTMCLILFNTTINENYFDLELLFLLTNVCRSLLSFSCFTGDRCMPRSSSQGILPLDPEIERTLRSLRNINRNLSSEFAMADEPPAAQHTRNAKILQASQGQQLQNEPWTLRDYLRPVVNENYSRIRRQTINANKFELKLGLITMVQQQQFGGLLSEDLHNHLSSFLELCDTVKYNSVPHDTIKLQLFPFSLRDKARTWFHALPKGSIETWDAMVQKFLTKFFPPQMTSQLRV